MKTVTPEGDGLITFILTIVMLVICLPTVVARIIVRLKIGALGLDDCMMAVGMVRWHLLSPLL